MRISEVTYRRPGQPAGCRGGNGAKCLAMDIAYGTDFHSLAVSKIQVWVHLSEIQERDGPSHCGQGHALSRLVQKMSKDHERVNAASWFPSVKLSPIRPRQRDEGWDQEGNGTPSSAVHCKRSPAAGPEPGEIGRLLRRPGLYRFAPVGLVESGAGGFGDSPQHVLRLVPDGSRTGVWRDWPTSTVRQRVVDKADEVRREAS